MYTKHETGRVISEWMVRFKPTFDGLIAAHVKLEIVKWLDCAKVTIQCEPFGTMLCEFESRYGNGMLVYDPETQTSSKVMWL